MDKAQHGHYQDTAQTSIQQGVATMVLRGSPSHDRCTVRLGLNRHRDSQAWGLTLWRRSEVAFAAEHLISFKGLMIQIVKWTTRVLCLLYCLVHSRKERWLCSATRPLDATKYYTPSIL